MNDAAAHPDQRQAYIEGIAPAFRPLFDRIDRLTRTLHPDVTAGMSYAMPTYWVGKRRLNVGVWKHGVSVYGWKKDTPSAFLARHPKLLTSTGTIRLTPEDADALSDDEIREVIASALGT